MTLDRPVLVVVGAGLGASQICASLAEARAHAHAGGSPDWSVVVVGEEPHLPYQRPPLSKSFLRDAREEVQLLRSPAFYDKAQMDLRLGWRAMGLDRSTHTLSVRPVRGGAVESLRYDHLVLACGSTPRSLPGLMPGLRGVHTLRNAEQALALRGDLVSGRRLVVVGGGFIGLEVAATAQSLGLAVTVLEGASRLLPRVMSPGLSQGLLAQHRAAGIDVRLDAIPSEVVHEAGRVTGVVCDGQWIAANVVLVAVGAQPRIELAQAAGLACDNGIVVDQTLCTTDPAISAIGDCCNFPAGGERRRLESVQNAQDQAKAVVSRLLGRPMACEATPWFWSDQGSARVQITGIWHAGLQCIEQPGRQAGAMTWLHFDGGTLVAAESINAPADQMAARKRIQQARQEATVPLCP